MACWSWKQSICLRIRRSLHNFRQCLGGWAALGSGASQPGSSDSSLTRAGGAVLWAQHSCTCCCVPAGARAAWSCPEPCSAVLLTESCAVCLCFYCWVSAMSTRYESDSHFNKKSNEFRSMVSDLDQAEVRTESFVPSLWTRLLSRRFTPRPSPGHAARRSVLWCWPSLLLFALPFVTGCFLALCTRGSQRLSWCDRVSGPPQQSCPGEDFLPVPFCAAGRAVMHFLGTRLMMLTWPP